MSTNNYANDIGDILWRSIQKNRTPLTDALVRIIVIMVISMAVLWLLEGFFALLQKKHGRNEADQSSLRFIFTMIRYVILVISLLIILRSCIAEISSGEATKAQDMIFWLHGNTVTLSEYAIKLLIALIVFIIFNAIQNGFFKLVKRHLDARGVKESFSGLVLNLVKYILLGFLVLATILQLIITGGDNLFALALYTYLCVQIGVPTREIRRFLSEKSPAMELLLTLMGRVLAMILLVALGFGIYAGLQYFLRSGGKDISPYLTMDEYELSAQLKTDFEENAELSRALSRSNDPVTVRSDRELNLIYYGDTLVGFNTTGRKYQIYGVAVNEPEISAVHNMMYGADGSKREVADFGGGASDSHYYYNRIRNDCLVLTVNRHSNRVVSVTYYNDFQRIQSSITLTEE